MSDRQPIDWALEELVHKIASRPVATSPENSFQAGEQLTNPVPNSDNPNSGDRTANEEAVNEEILAARLRASLPPEKYCPLLPSPKQLAFLLSDELEVLYGGAAAGGKTVALAMAALQYVNVPYYSALLLRRTYTEGELPDAVNNVVHDWLRNSDAQWDGATHVYTFPSGAHLTLGYLDNDDAMKRYDSAQFQFIGFDELTHWPEHQYIYLFRRLRRASATGVPLRMRAATNPGGIGHAWVKKRFIDEASPDRLFIPALMADNPHVQSDEYTKSLEQTDYITRKRLLEGNWDVQDNLGLFKREWFQTVRVDELPFDITTSPTVRYWDFAATEPKPGKEPDWTIGCKATLYKGRLYVLDVIRLQARPYAIEEKFARALMMDGPHVKVFIEQEPGSAGIHLVSHYQIKFPGFSIRGDKVTGPKRARWEPVSASAEAGNVLLVKAPWNTPFVNVLEVVGTGAEPHDDDADALAGAHRNLTAGRVEAYLALYAKLQDEQQKAIEAATPLNRHVFKAKECHWCRREVKYEEPFVQQDVRVFHVQCLRDMTNGIRPTI